MSGSDVEKDEGCKPLMIWTQQAIPGDPLWVIVRETELN